jgi:ribosome-associated protein
MATKKKTNAKTSGGRTPARKKTASKGPAGKAPARKKTAGKAPAGRAPARKKKARLPPAPVQTTGPAENPAAKKLAGRIAQLLLDKKALDVVILDVRGMTSYADYFVIASGESDRQVSAMAENVQVQLKTPEEGGNRPIGTEGLETGQWVLLDYGEVVAHLFLTDLRAHYDLEGLWADAAREKVA